MDRALIENLIEKHEGRRHGVYKDTFGNLTIGVGWNLEDADSETICEHFGLRLSDLRCGLATLTDSQISQVFDYQVTAVISAAMSIFPNFVNMPDGVQAVVCDLIFNMGETRFRKFVSTIAVLKAGDWKQAANDLTSSLWFHQVGHRATEDVALLRSA
jgi:GH24 family phage-related lysozyme (muramidase)